MKLEAVSATVLPRGGLKKTFLNELKENAGNTGKTAISIRHPAQQRITRSHSSMQQFLFKRVTYETLGVCTVFFVCR